MIFLQISKPSWGGPYDSLAPPYFVMGGPYPSNNYDLRQHRRNLLRQTRGTPEPSLVFLEKNTRLVNIVVPQGLDNHRPQDSRDIAAVTRIENLTK